MASFSNAGPTRLRELRLSGSDPSHRGEAAQKRRTALEQRRREQLEWDAHRPEVEGDETTFMTEILPRLQAVPVARIAAVTGLSKQYCSLIRRGLKVPHPRHWETFLELGDAR